MPKRYRKLRGDTAYYPFAARTGLRARQRRHAIMVTPIIASDTPKWRAITVPSSTSKSAPTTTAAAPIKNLTILSNRA